MLFKLWLLLLTYIYIFFQIEVEFEGYSASLEDFFGIKSLLASIFKGIEVPLTEITDMVVNQCENKGIGCVIKVGS